MANKGNNDVELPPGSSHSSPLSKEETEKNVETGKQSSHKNDESNPDSKTTVKIENSSKPEEKPEVTSSLQDLTTSGFPQERQTEMNDSESNVKPDTTLESENNTISEPGEKLEVETGKQSSHRNDESNPDSKTTVKIENSSKPEEKPEVTSSLQDMTTSGLPQERQTEMNDSESNVKPDTTLESENNTISEPGEKPEESPLNIQTPKEEEEETARDINEENVKDENKVQDQEQNLSVQGSNKTLWICAVAAVGILLAVLVAFMHCPDTTSPKPNESDLVKVFNQEMEKLEASFQNQRPELWRRSLIHLRRHLKTKNPSEPVSLILTSGYRAEKTLDCLARCLARAFTTAFNSSVLNINGKSKASQDSDQVKLDIDRELRNAFEGKKSAAVIHRFEELPPGSTLIFYRYCDHENAAYKNVFLAFTVMLDGEVEVPSNVSLGRVEEMVQEHIKRKFVSSDKSAMFNQMDVDKLSGLWSRISHLILPVVAEEKIEQQGCGDFDKSF